MEMSAHELRQDYAAFESWDEDQHNDPIDWEEMTDSERESFDDLRG